MHGTNCSLALCAAAVTVAQDMMRNIIKDTSVLMAASATWYGVQVGEK